MKLLSFMLAASGLLAACKTTVIPAAPMLADSQPFELVKQKTTIIPVNGGGSISLTLTDVQDARCPSGTQCIWAGYAAVTVQLTDATATPQTARIALLIKDLPTYTRDSVSVTLNQKPYWLRLLEVNPYPGTGSGQPPAAKLRLRPA
jgi:hypothetical protein